MPRRLTIAMPEGGGAASLQAVWLWLLAAWAAGAIAFVSTCAIARRNLAALLGPQA